MLHHHTHTVAPNQCCSSFVQAIDALVATMWSVIRRFDNLHAYKHLFKSCHMIDDDDNVRTFGEVHVVSALPTMSSTKRLEILDDEKHVMSFSKVGSDHILHNYRSVTIFHVEVVAMLG
ncbi:Abscisic acid receptor PYL4 [Forsythia ovata]|uniref:Abscisic acid receptor PYL4 n=1 Tax=Forsythia ovata TaxID=205694 RepID=A0ABD1PJB6_9LAMI